MYIYFPEATSKPPIELLDTKSLNLPLPVAEHKTSLLSGMNIRSFVDDTNAAESVGAKTKMREFGIMCGSSLKKGGGGEWGF